MMSKPTKRISDSSCCSTISTGTTTTTNATRSVAKYEKYQNTYLAKDFVPSPRDVVCARGKSYWDHEGNKMYRSLIAGATEKYASTTNKLEKTLIVSEIVNAVHKQNGMFVKKERKGGPWVEVDEVFAREKIGQSLRDGLHDKYRSATKTKKQRKEKVTEKFNGDIDRVIHSNVSVSRRIEELTEEVRRNGALASDFSIVELFSRANSDILETIKKDSSMLHQFQNASNAANKIIEPDVACSSSSSPTMLHHHRHHHHQ